MRHFFTLLLFLMISPALTAQKYFPGKWGDWEKKAPAEVGMSQAWIDSAIQYAQRMESTNPRSMEENHYGTFGREPFGYGIGPFKDRGSQTGIIVKNGYIVAEWGEPFRVDMTHSISKSFLTYTTGLAFDKGLIRDVNDKVDTYMAPILVMNWDDNRNKADHYGSPKLMEPFKSEHNSKITWDHLLRQTSDWEGVLWGKPDWADRPARDRSQWGKIRNEPGTVYEYNDVRVNLLALALMNVLREPLPKVLRKEIMDKIGASPTWRWQGYENSWVVIDGQQMQVVSGGGHWGGGMFLSARDQARFGLLTLNNGNWNGEQLVSEKWNKMAQSPGVANDKYGYMNWFLNTDKERFPNAPESVFVHLGSGTNMVYVDSENDLVIVARWVQGSAMQGIIDRVLNSMNE